MRKLQARRDTGFTLIELLIVIIVLGILVAIVLFSLGTFKSDSQTAACKADIKQLQTAESAYVAKSSATNPSDSAAQLVADNFLQSAPTQAGDGKSLDVEYDNSASPPTVKISTDGGTTWVLPGAAAAAC